MGGFKVVVWQSAYLGDVILVSNLLLNLHEHFPDREITLVAQPFAEELYKGVPWLRVIPLEKTLRGTWEVVKKIKGFNLGFGVQRGMRTSLALFAARVKLRVGFDKAELSSLYHFTAKHQWGIHEVERNQRLLKALGLKIFTGKLFLPIHDGLLQRVKEKFNLPERFVVVSPSAQFEPKRWHEKYFAKVISRLTAEGFPVVITGGRGKDELIARKVLEFLGGERSDVINLAGKTTVGELVHLIKLADLVIANDSAPVHIAEAVDTPVVTVYCATSPYYGFYPRSGIHLFPKNLSCHPCKPNPKHCLIGEPLCRTAVKPEEVINAALNLL